MAFDSDTFIRRLLGEALFYDEEYGVGGTLSLVDPTERKERYLAAFIPEDDQFVIEEATEWEDYDDADDEIGYALAVDSKEMGCFDEIEQVTEALLTLAREHGLEPSLTLRYEEDEDE